MKMKKIILTIVSFCTILVSCEVSENLNVDQKSPTTVPASGLFTNGLRNFFDQQNSSSVNDNPLRMYAQYWAQTTYPEESQYTQTTRNIGGNMWNGMYRDVLQDLKGAKETIIANNDANADNKLACIGIMEVSAYAYLVEIFGDVPYTDALEPTNPSPKYDDAETIYLDLFAKLDAAVALIDASSSGFDASQDPVYGSDMGMWKTAANSLKLRMAMLIADSNPGVSKQMAEAAFGAGVILSASGNFSITYEASAPNTNPVWEDLVQSGRNDYVASNTMVDYMNDLVDPRLEFYYELHEGAYSGGTYGSANAATGFSSLSDELKSPTLEGNYITVAQVRFLLAEAAARGYSVGGDAATHYAWGITESIMKWGGDQAMVDTYLANADVAFATAAGTDMQKIGFQKWIAMFNNGMEGWTTYRLFDYPVLNEIETGDQNPTRFLYPVNEATLNGPSYDAGAAAIGGDTKTNKLFFDVN